MQKSTVLIGKCLNTTVVDRNNYGLFRRKVKNDRKRLFFPNVTCQTRNSEKGDKKRPARIAGSDQAECGLACSEVTAAVMKVSLIRPAAGGVSRTARHFFKS